MDAASADPGPIQGTPEAIGDTHADEPVETIELVPTAIVAGGDALARDADGRVLFVRGALPGERVRAELTGRRKDHAFAVVREVLDASPHRVVPPCRFVAQGCGGCQWQHIDPAHQPALLTQIVHDALSRIARIESPPLQPVVVLPSQGYRTSLRMAVVGGKLAFTRRASHYSVVVDACLVAHPLLAGLLATDRIRGAREVELRAGANTGDRMVVADRPITRHRFPADVRIATRGDDTHYHEVIAQQRYRISAGSFFQSRADGAEALVHLVTAAVSEHARPGAHVVDLYAGVGLFALALAVKGFRVSAVEGSPSAAKDARLNLRDRDAKVVQTAVEQWKPRRASVVVADPSRAGLGRDGVDRVVATDATRVVLVSCDAAAAARDIRLLGDAGFRLERVTPVDLFPHTAHVEIVSVLDRG